MTNKQAVKIARALIRRTVTPETVKSTIEREFEGYKGYDLHFMLGQADVEVNGYHFVFVLQSGKDEAVKVTQAVVLDSHDKIVCNFE